jgi:hypothetical protein
VIWLAEKEKVKAVTDLRAEKNAIRAERCVNEVFIRY